MQEIYDLIIIGSGPAGLSAAVYGMRAGLKLLVVEKNPMSGGQVLNTYEVDNYLGMPGFNGFDMGMKFRISWVRLLWRRKSRASRTERLRPSVPQGENCGPRP